MNRRFWQSVFTLDSGWLTAAALLLAFLLILRLV